MENMIIAAFCFSDFLKEFQKDNILTMSMQKGNMDKER